MRCSLSRLVTYPEFERGSCGWATPLAAGACWDSWLWVCEQPQLPGDSENFQLAPRLRLRQWLSNFRACEPRVIYKLLRLGSWLRLFGPSDSPSQKSRDSSSIVRTTELCLMRSPNVDFAISGHADANTLGQRSQNLPPAILSRRTAKL